MPVLRGPTTVAPPGVPLAGLPAMHTYITGSSAMTTYSCATICITALSAMTHSCAYGLSSVTTDSHITPYTYDSKSVPGTPTAALQPAGAPRVGGAVSSPARAATAGRCNAAAISTSASVNSCSAHCHDFRRPRPPSLPQPCSTNFAPA